MEWRYTTNIYDTCAPEMVPSPHKDQIVDKNMVFCRRNMPCQVQFITEDSAYKATMRIIYRQERVQ